MIIKVENLCSRRLINVSVGDYNFEVTEKNAVFPVDLQQCNSVKIVSSYKKDKKEWKLQMVFDILSLFFGVPGSELKDVLNETTVYTLNFTVNEDTDIEVVSSSKGLLVEKGEESLSGVSRQRTVNPYGKKVRIFYGVFFTLLVLAIVIPLLIATVFSAVKKELFPFVCLLIITISVIWGLAVSVISIMRNPKD